MDNLPELPDFVVIMRILCDLRSIGGYSDYYHCINIHIESSNTNYRLFVCKSANAHARHFCFLKTLIVMNCCCDYIIVHRISPLT